MKVSWCLLNLFVAIFLTATATSNTGVALSPVSKILHGHGVHKHGHGVHKHGHGVYKPGHGVYKAGRGVYTDDRATFPFLNNFPRFHQRVRHLSIRSYNDMIADVYDTFLHCIKIEELVATVYLYRATDQGAATQLRLLRDYQAKKHRMLKTLHATYGVNYDHVPFFGNYRYTPDKLPNFRGGVTFDRDYGFDAELRIKYRNTFFTRAFNIYVFNLGITKQVGLAWRNQLLGRGAANYQVLNLIRRLRRELARRTANFRGFYRVPFFGDLNRFGRRFGPTGFGTLGRRGFVPGRTFSLGRDPSVFRDRFGPGRFGPIGPFALGRGRGLLRDRRGLLGPRFHSGRYYGPGRTHSGFGRYRHGFGRYRHGFGRYRHGVGRYRHGVGRYRHGFGRFRPGFGRSRRVFRHTVHSRFPHGKGYGRYGRYY